MYVVQYNSASTIKQLFERIINKTSIQALLQGHQLESVEDNTVRPNNSQQMQVRWKSLKQEKLYFNIFFYSSGLYFIDALFNMNDFRIYMKDIQLQISNLEKCNWRDVLGFGIIT